MNCLLTGATGIVGSHILFEWIRKAIVDQSVNHLYVIIRDGKVNAEQRLLEILKAPSRPAFLNDYSIESCLENDTVFALDLSMISMR